MAQYLLVHGAWHGAWCWQHVTEGLIRAGHSAHALTLTGLGERSHLLHRGIDLETHVQDVLQALDAQEMQDAILVVHSYAGMLGTAVADRHVNRLKQHACQCHAKVAHRCCSRKHQQQFSTTRPFCVWPGWRKLRLGSKASNTASLRDLPARVGL